MIIEKPNHMQSLHSFFLMPSSSCYTTCSSYYFFATTSFNSLSKRQRQKRKKQKQQQNQNQNQNQNQKQNHKHRDVVYYPKSTPTPLLIPHQPYTQTKLQALDAVIKDLQSSIHRGVQIDIHIFSSLLETCFKLGSLQHAIQIHYLIPPYLLRNNLGLSSKLLRIYASSGFLEHAHRLFDGMPRRHATSAFPWNSLISGYTQVGKYEDAMALYFEMKEEAIQPDEFTFPRVLKACARLGSIQIGEAIHLDTVRSGFTTNAFVLNALVDMYAKCGNIVKARNVFDKIVSPDSVSWNSILTAYIHHGLIAHALDMFRSMLHDGFEPDSIAISAILSKLWPFRNGLEVHGWVIRRGLQQHLSISNSLISFYSEQGKLDRSRWLFNTMTERDLISWNSIISGHCKDMKALEYFEHMEKSNVLPDNVTFVSLLSMCAHHGLLEDGRRLFKKMKEKYRLRPIMEHYACMVNLFGRAGLIDEAYQIIMKQMEFEAGPTVWGALLYACSLHGNADVGKIAAERLFELEPDNAHNFELLIKIYGMDGRWEEVEKVMQLMVDRGLDS